MADTFADILFRGGFDPSEIIRGIDSMIAALKRSQEQEASLRKEIDVTSLALKDNEQKIQKVTLTIAGLDKGAKGFNATNKTLNAELASLNKVHAEYTNTLTSQNSQLKVIQGTNEKLAATYDKATLAVNNMHEATGKTIAPSLNDGKILNQTRVIKENVTSISSDVNKTVNAAKVKLNELISTQGHYKIEIKEINAALQANQKEYNATAKQIEKLIASGKGAEAETAALRKQLAATSASTVDFKNQLSTAQTGLANTTASIKTQNVVLKEAEAAGNGFFKGLGKVFSGLRTLAYILPGIGIGGLIALISGPVIDVFEEWFATLGKTSDALKTLKANEENLNEVIATANKESGKQVADLKILYQAATDVNLSMKDRLAAVKGLQTEFPDFFGNIKTETILNGQAKDAYDKLTDSIIATAGATAAKGKIDEIESKRLDIDFQKQKIVNATANESARAKDRILSSATTGSSLTGGGASGVDVTITRAEQLKVIEQRKKDALAIQDVNDKSLRDQEDFLIKFIGLNKLAATVETETKAGKTAGGNKQALEDDFEKRKAEFEAQISKLTASEYESELNIRKQYADKLDKALLDISKDKSITAGEARQLNELAKTLNTAELDKALSDLHKKVLDEQKKFNDEIDAINLQAATNRVALIQDDYERERQTIIAEEASKAASYKNARDKQLDELNKAAKIHEYAPGYVAAKTKEINDAFASLISTLEQTKNQRLDKLSFDTFNKLSEDARKTFLENKNFDITETGLIDIQKQAALFTEGKISYAQFQKALTKIEKEESDKRLRNEIDANRKLIGQLSQKLFLGNDKLTDPEKEALLKRIRELEQQIDENEKKLSVGGVDPQKENTGLQKFFVGLDAYVRALNDVVQKVGSFWQQVNDLEQRALERSIAIQDKRVEAAQNVAARGNAEYLRLEEERQQKLVIKQENAARRQMAINAALQASQLLTAITGAIASAVTASGPLAPLVIAGDIASIVGALAAGYALVSSLKQPSFFVGTEDTGPGGRADSKGGFHSVLHPHERVMTAKQNKELGNISNKQVVEHVKTVRLYEPALKAMQKKTIPPATLSYFVESWKSKPVPRLNVAAMDMASSISTTHSIQLTAIMEESNRKLEENNQLQKGIIKALKSMGVSVNVDRNGVAVSVLEEINQRMRNLRL